MDGPDSITLFAALHDGGRRGHTVDWHAELFSKLQALPTDGRAVTTWKNQDEAWLDIATGVRKIVHEQLGKNNALALDNERLQREVERLKGELARKPEQTSAERDAAPSHTPSLPQTLPPHAETLEVRRAYRRIYSFQRRMFDMLAELSDELRALDLNFDRWDPMHASRPAKSSTEFFRKTHWAWDFLPAYGFECIWCGTDKEAQGRHVVVEVDVDTGWRNKRQEPDPVDFTPASDAKSLIGISLLRSTNPKIIWAKAWTEVLSKHKDIFDGHDHTFPMGSATLTYRYFSVEISQLIGESAVQDQLVAPIRSWSKANGANGMPVPQSIRVLPMGKEICSSYEAVLKFFSEDIKTREDIGRYYYRSSAMLAEAGTLVLFQYDGRIVAHAIMESDGKVVSADRLAEGYAGYYRFDPASIKVYARPLTQTELNEIWPDVVLSQVMHRLDASAFPRYQKLLQRIEG